MAFWQESVTSVSSLVVADCQLSTSELLRLDEPAECCAILPRSEGGPWGQHWQQHCRGSPEPPTLPSGSTGDEYSFAVRPISREVAAQFSWQWSLDQQQICVPTRDVHRLLGFPQPYIISPRWWTDVLATLTWKAMASFDLGDLAAGLYRIFLLPRSEADGGVRAIVVADKAAVTSVKMSMSMDSAVLRRKKRLDTFIEHVSRLPPLGEWISSSRAVPSDASDSRVTGSGADSRLRGWAHKSKVWGFGTNKRWCELYQQTIYYWAAEADAGAHPARGTVQLEGATVGDGGSRQRCLQLQLADGSRVSFEFDDPAEAAVWLREARAAALGAGVMSERTDEVDDRAAAQGAPAAGGLFPHQVRTVAWMEQMEAEVRRWGGGHLTLLAKRQRVRLPRGGLIAHPPGAGKTRCVCELLRRSHSDGERTLVLAPPHLARQWRAELDAHAGAAAAAATEVFEFDDVLRSARVDLGHRGNGDTRLQQLLRRGGGVRRVVVDEPQDALAATGWELAFHRAMRSAAPRTVWALCGTAAAHVGAIASLLLFDEPPEGEDARAMATVALVHRRALRDPPSRCLPAPPLRSQDVPVALSADEAGASQLALLSGHLMDALLLCAFGRSAAFAAAPERAAVLHRDLRGRDGRGGGFRRGYESGARAAGSLASGEALQLTSWSGAMEADVTARLSEASARLTVAEAEAAKQQSAFVAAGGVIGAAPRPRGGGGAFGDLFATQREAAEEAAAASGETPPEWLADIVDNASDMAGIEPALAAQLGELRRTVSDCARALRFSKAMRELVASKEAECPVCLQTYEVAAVLPCLHATCRDCMRTHAGERAAGFRCPLCRKAVSRAEVVTFTKAPVKVPVVLGVPTGQPIAAAAADVVRQLSGGAVAVAGIVVQGVVRQLSGGISGGGAGPSSAASGEAASSAPPAPAAGGNGRWEVSALLQARQPPSERELPGASSRVRVLVGMLRAILDSGDDERVLVFAQWAAHIQYLATTLQAAGVAYLTLGSSLSESMRSLQAFGQPGQPRVLLMSSQRHASGINLQMARHVVILHPYCTPTARNARQLSTNEMASYERQAIGRVRRFPQQRQVEVYKLFAPGTVEEEVVTGRIQQA